MIALPVYYPLMRIGENLAVEGKLSAPFAMLMADGALALAGTFILVRVVRA